MAMIMALLWMFHCAPNACLSSKLPEIGTESHLAKKERGPMGSIVLGEAAESGGHQWLEYVG